MDLDQYFRNRAELIGRVLTDRASRLSATRDWRLYALAGAGLLGSMALETWATMALADLGVFARFSSFVSLASVGTFSLLAIAVGAEATVACVEARSRDAIVEKVFGQMLRIDGRPHNQA